MRGERTCRPHKMVRTRPIISIISPIILVLLYASGCASGAVFLKDGSDVTGNDTFEAIISGANTSSGNYSIEFFYNNQCGACHVAMAYLNEYNAAHPDIIINSYDLFNSSDNRALFEEYKAAYHRSYVSVPSLFIGDVGLEGESAIREHFEPLVAWNEKDRNTSAPQPDNVASKSGALTHRTTISVPLVLIAGFIDGINPCASAVLIFLFIFLIAVRQRLRVLLAGAVFSTAVFFFYFLSGVGLITISRHSGVVFGSSLIAGIVAVIAGLLVFTDAIIPGIRQRLIPVSMGETAARNIERLAIPIAFFLGLIVGVFELPCTGGIYRAILDMISFKVNMGVGLVYLTLYNLAFVIPLLVITGLVYWGMPPERVREWRSGKQRALRLLIGLLLFLFALLVLTGIM